jgi:hypothetical protein
MMTNPRTITVPIMERGLRNNDRTQAGTRLVLVAGMTAAPGRIAFVVVAIIVPL